MTDWVAVFRDHLEEMRIWARVGAAGTTGRPIGPHLDPEACIMDAWQDLYEKDRHASNPVGMWKVAARRLAVQKYRRMKSNLRAISDLATGLGDGEVSLVQMDRCRRAKPAPNPTGFGPGFVLEAVPCPICGTLFKPRMQRQRNGVRKRRAACSLLCGQKLRRLNEQRPDGCGKPGHRPYVRRASGRRECADCHNEGTRRRRAERRAA